MLISKCMGEIITPEIGDSIVTKAIERLRRRANEVPDHDKRAAVAAVLNQALLSLDRKEPDNNEWVDNETDDEKTVIHSLITEKSIHERKQKDSAFKSDPIASPIHNLENLIPTMEQRYKKFVSLAFRDLSYDLGQIKDLDPGKIQEILLDKAVNGTKPLL